MNTLNYLKKLGKIKVELGVLGSGDEHTNRDATAPPTIPVMLVSKARTQSTTIGCLIVTKYEGVQKS